MAGTRNATGFARNALVVLALLLIAGISGSVWMGMRARNEAISLIVAQVQTLSDRSLTLVIHPTDLTSPAFGDRKIALADQITASVLDTSPFTTVTLWSSDGRILFSTDAGRIGNQLPGEKDSIAAAMSGRPQTQDVGGSFSVTVPFKLPSGVGAAAAIEMSRPDSTIVSAAGPWRTNALFLTILLGFVCFLLFRVRRIGELLGSHLAFSQPKTAGPPPPLLPITRPRSGELSLGIRQEAEARGRAEERAASAEQRAATLQEKYRKALEELQEAQHDLRAKPGNSRLVPQLEERALKAEGRVRTLEGQVLALQTEREKLAEDLSEERSATPGNKSGGSDKLMQAQQEVVGLRAELDGAQTQLAMLKRQAEAASTGDDRSAELQDELDSAHLQALHSREAADTATAELKTATAELDNVRTELRTLRNEAQRAAMLEDELRAAKAELEDVASESRAGQTEMETEAEAQLEAKVRKIRKEFQNQLASMESSYRDQLSQHDLELADRLAVAERQARETSEELKAATANLKSAHEEAAAARDRLLRQADQHAATAAEFEAMKAQLAERQDRFDKAGDQAKRAGAEAEATASKLEKTRTELLAAREQFEAQRARADELSTALAQTDAEAKEALQRAGDLAARLDAASQSNVDLNRRMQEVESRRALEIAGTEGRADLDEILRVTQERLAGQTEKLIHAEERAHELERDVMTLSKRNEEVEAQLRQRNMAGAIRQLRGEGETPELVEVSAAPESHASEDHRSASPFVNELSLDAKKSLARILGVTQVLKHKREAKDQAQLIKQLTAYARRLDHTVSDLIEADALAMGTVELNIKRTDLKALAVRVVEESGVGEDHDIRLETESLIVGVDQRRTEQILAGLLLTSGDRTPAGKTIFVKLSHVDGGALLFVEDPEPAAENALSPVVKRFAEVQGGWARVESLESGGSSFRVFLPDGGPDPSPRPSSGEEPGSVDQEAAAPGRKRTPPIVVEEPWDPAGEEFLVKELHRLSELPASERAGRGRRR